MTRVRHRLVCCAAALSAVFLAGCMSPTLAPPAGSSNADLFDAMWHEVDLNYSMFGLKRVNWDSVGLVNRPAAIAAPTDAALARVLGGILMTLHDRHVSLTPGTAGPVVMYSTSGDAAPAAFDAALIEHRYLSDATAWYETHVLVGRLSSSLGYVRIPSFGGDGWVGDVDDALRSLADMSAIVVDVRCNFGGNYDLALQIAGRFADHQRTFGYVKVRNGPRHDDFTPLIPETVRPAGPMQFHGPVYVLTNRKVYSSAENFVLAMQALPTVTTVGDTTAGSSGKPIVRALPNGWTYEVSSWLEYTSAQVPYEDVGLPPAVYVASRAADIRAGVDVVLERAIVLATAAMRTTTLRSLHAEPTRERLTPPAADAHSGATRHVQLSITAR